MTATMGPMKFGDLQKGMKGRVVSIPDTPENGGLREMGLNEGVKISVAKLAPFGDTIEI